MPKDDLRVFPRPNGTWAMQRDGATRAISTYDTKRAALEAGRRQATRDGVELTVQHRCGWITEAGMHLLEDLSRWQQSHDMITSQRVSPA